LLRFIGSRARQRLIFAAAFSLLPVVVVAQAEPRPIEYTLTIPTPETHLTT
jgi:hypothetical protein